MGIKIQANGLYTVSCHKRHPITRAPLSLKRINIESKAQANKIFRDLVLQIEEKIKRKLVPAWGELLTKYFHEIRSSELTQSTIYNREKMLFAYTIPDWENHPVDVISKANILELMNSKLGDKSEAHRKFYIKCVRSVFQFACDRDFIPKNPTPLLKFKIPKKIRCGLNESEVQLLLRKAKELDWPWYPHYAVAIFTGLRNGELYALAWDKVDLERRQIIVNVSWNNKDGFKSTKSGDDRRVEIPLPLLPLLRELKLQSFDSHFVLPRLVKWDKGEQARELRLLLKVLNLPEIRFHDLRATWATLLLSKGVPPSKVMAMGGWKDMETMMIYMRQAGIDIKDSTHVLNNFSFNSPEPGQLLEMPNTTNQYI